MSQILVKPWQLIQQLSAVTLVFLIFLLPATAAKLDFTNGVLSGINGIYEAPASLNASHAPVVCHIDCTHPDTIRAGMKKTDRGHLGYLAKLQKRIEAASGLPYVVVHYSQLEASEFHPPCVKAVVVTRMDKSIDQAVTKRLLAVLKSVQVPMIGFCGGHQLIVEAYGGKISTMRKLMDGEKDPHPAYHPGLMKEWGFMAVKVIKPDPFFNGLGAEIMIQQFHAYEVTSLPKAFEILASSDLCRVQAVKHKDKPIYGTQFHPEHFNPEHPDGEILLKNFFIATGVKTKP